MSRFVENTHVLNYPNLTFSNFLLKLFYDKISIVFYNIVLFFNKMLNCNIRHIFGFYFYIFR